MTQAQSLADERSEAAREIKEILGRPHGAEPRVVLLGRNHAALGSELTQLGGCIVLTRLDTLADFRAWIQSGVKPDTVVDTGVGSTSERTEALLMSLGLLDASGTFIALDPLHGETSDSVMQASILDVAFSLSGVLVGIRQPVQAAAVIDASGSAEASLPTIAAHRWLSAVIDKVEVGKRMIVIRRGPAASIDEVALEPGDLPMGPLFLLSAARSAGPALTNEALLARIALLAAELARSARLAKRRDLDLAAERARSAAAEDLWLISLARLISHPRRLPAAFRRMALVVVRQCFRWAIRLPPTRRLANATRNWIRDA